MNLRKIGTPFVNSCAALFERLGFTPNAVTILALVIGLLNSALFVISREPLLFASIGLLSAPLDAIDGALARRLGTTTRWGAYLDAMCDRAYDAAGVFAAAWVTGHWALSLIAIVGADAISYAKARAAMEVYVPNHSWPDLMQRESRVIFFGIGIVLIGFWPQTYFLGKDLFYCNLIVLNILIYITIFQRILRAKSFLILPIEDPL